MLNDECITVGKTIKIYKTTSKNSPKKLKEHGQLIITLLWINDKKNIYNFALSKSQLGRGTSIKVG